MKTLLFIIILLSIVVSGYSQQYNYNKIVVVTTGSDNFAFDNKTIKKEAGQIEILTDALKIGDKTIALKKQVSDNVYRGKNCTVEYMYCNGSLNAIRLTKAGADTYYVLQTAENNLTYSSAKL